MSSQEIDFKLLQLAYYNGNAITKIVVNGVRVWEKIVTTETYTENVAKTRWVSGGMVKTGALKTAEGASASMPMLAANVKAGQILYHDSFKKYIYFHSIEVGDIEYCIIEGQCLIKYYEVTSSQVQETYYELETKTRDVTSYVYGP